MTGERPRVRPDERSDGGSDGRSDGGPRRLPRSIYVHAPFCARRCLYCDFAVAVDARPDPGPWARAIQAEWALLEAEEGSQAEAPLRSLYVGGGTPSLLGPGAMKALGGILGSALPSDLDLEWTAEANPESFTRDLAEAWRRAGVNRISLGAQTFDRGALKWMGRLHGPEGIARAVDVGRRAGFESISLDLIFALPDGLDRSLSDDLDRVLALAPEHVSVYGLTAERRTPLGRAVREGREVMADEVRYEEEFLLLTERLRGAGYHHYEVSNFAVPGRESIHNQVYWTGAPYLGLGNGAHSYRHPTRRWNIRDWAAYSTAVLAGRLPVEGSEIIGPGEERLEHVWLSLRTSRGLPADELTHGGERVAERWASEGRAEMIDGTLRLTPRGWLLLDRLAVELDTAQAQAGARSEAGVKA